MRKVTFSFINLQKKTTGHYCYINYTLEPGCIKFVTHLLFSALKGGNYSYLLALN